MFTLLFTGITVVAIGVALWSSQRGEERQVDGAGNNHESYYGKDRWQPGISDPCDECRPLGCIGSGECRCKCHKPFSKKKK